MKSNGELEYGDRVRVTVMYPRLYLPAEVTQHSVGTIMSKHPDIAATYIVNFSEINENYNSVAVSTYDITYRKPDKIGKGFRQLICQLCTLERHYKKNGRELQVSNR